MGLLLVVVLGFVLASAGRVAEARARPDPSAFLGATRSYSKEELRRCGYNDVVDELYATDLAPRLGDDIYLDYTGSSLYLNGQLDRVMKARAQEYGVSIGELRGGVFGNPHTNSSSSRRTEDGVEGVRRALLRHFNADPAEYDLVFTRSATGALQLLGELFPWSRRSRFAYLTSNHMSVLGIRLYARQHGAAYGAVDEASLEAWLAGEAEELAPAAGTALPAWRPGEEGAAGGEDDGPRPTYSLFAYPAQDNMAGVLYPLDWVRAVQAKSTRRRRWKVLLDAAAFLPTHPLDLGATPADFVCISFYKLFGYPTGSGALIVRKENTAGFLEKKYFGGGSMWLATSTVDWAYFLPPPRHYEDGTVAFLDILGLRHGLEQLEALGGIHAVRDHVDCVGDHLYDSMRALRHSNGRPMVRPLVDRPATRRRDVRGGAMAFEVLQPDGTVFPYKVLAAELADSGFHVRDGCMCNPGACYNATGVREEEVIALAEAKAGDFSDWQWAWVDRPEGGGVRKVRVPLGCVRISLGWMSRLADVEAVVGFIGKQYRDRYEDPHPAPLGQGPWAEAC